MLFLTKSSFSNLFDALLVAAMFLQSAMCDTNSALEGSNFASLVAATTLIGAMQDTNSETGGSIGAPLVAATFQICSVHCKHLPSGLYLHTHQWLKPLTFLTLCPV